MSNKWICHNCKTLNEPDAQGCHKCKKLKWFNGEHVYKVENGNQVTYVRRPTTWGRDLVFFSKSRFSDTNCPVCNMIVCMGDDACIHCHHFFSSEEKLNLVPNNMFGAAFYLKSAVFWGGVIFLLVALFA